MQFLAGPLLILSWSFDLLSYLLSLHPTLFFPSTFLFCSLNSPTKAYHDLERDFPGNLPEHGECLEKIHHCLVANFDGTYISHRTSGNTLCKVGRVRSGVDKRFRDLHYTRFPSFAAISDFSLQFSSFGGKNGFKHKGSIFGFGQRDQSKEDIKKALNGSHWIPQDWNFQLHCPNLPSLPLLEEDFPLAFP